MTVRACNANLLQRLRAPANGAIAKTARPQAKAQVVVMRRAPDAMRALAIANDATPARVAIVSVRAQTRVPHSLAWAMLPFAPSAMRWKAPRWP